MQLMVALSVNGFSPALHNSKQKSKQNKTQYATYLYQHVFLLRQATPRTFCLLSFPVWSALFTLSLIWASFIPPPWSCTWLWSAGLGTLPFLPYHTKDTALHCSLSSAKSRGLGVYEGITFWYVATSPVCFTPCHYGCLHPGLFLYAFVLNKPTSATW